MKSGLGDEKPYWSYEDIGVFSLVLAVLAPILHLFARAFIFSHDPNLRIWSRPAGRSDRVFDAIVVLDTQTTASATGVPTIRLGLAAHGLRDPRAALRGVACSRCESLPPLAWSEHADQAARRDNGTGIGARADP